MSSVDASFSYVFDYMNTGKELPFESICINRNAALLTILPVYVSKNTGLYFLILLFLSI